MVREKTGSVSIVSAVGSTFLILKVSLQVTLSYLSVKFNNEGESAANTMLIFVRSKYLLVFVKMSFFSSYSTIITIFE